ncbi:class I SAM-dependent methyltransferase [bacterium]|nr:class I SAM-dependent methyltransferase [bacterium]
MAIKRLFRFWQRLGIHVVPNHFYEPVPDTRQLAERLWEVPSACVGLNWNEAQQVDLLQRLSAAYRAEYAHFPFDKPSIPHEYYLNNPSFKTVDGEMLYSMVRHFKPRRIFEIGSGNSTYLSAKALLKNQQETGQSCELTAFEPYPNEVLRAGFPGLSALVRKPVQEIPWQEFSKLGENDILFIDSSHVLKIGSDVQYEVLELLPRLNPGVIIHLHDIFLPAEYPREWVKQRQIFWTEQYLLQAFLAFNDSFEVLWGGSYMHLNHRDKLQAAFPAYDPARNWPGSIWLRKVK